MEDKEVIEGNKLIAEFMGLKAFEDSRYGTLWPDPLSSRTSQFNLKYHTSWDWLMPVCQKIRGHYFDTKENFPSGKAAKLYAQLQLGLLQMDIQALRSCAVEYIKWYNTQTGTKCR